MAYEDPYKADLKLIEPLCDDVLNKRLNSFGSGLWTSATGEQVVISFDISSISTYYDVISLKMNGFKFTEDAFEFAAFLHAHSEFGIQVSFSIYPIDYKNLLGFKNCHKVQSEFGSTAKRLTYDNAVVLNKAYETSSGSLFQSANGTIYNYLSIYNGPITDISDELLEVMMEEINNIRSILKKSKETHSINKILNPMRKKEVIDEL